jgi:hypothetical protein
MEPVMELPGSCLFNNEEEVAAVIPIVEILRREGHAIYG